MRIQTNFYTIELDCNVSFGFRNSFIFSENTLVFIVFAFDGDI